jgi:hypothetical protein
VRAGAGAALNGCVGGQLKEAKVRRTTAHMGLPAAVLLSLGGTCMGGSSPLLLQGVLTSLSFAVSFVRCRAQALKANPEGAPKEFKINANYISKMGQVWQGTRVWWVEISRLGCSRRAGGRASCSGVAGNLRLPYYRACPCLLPIMLGVSASVRSCVRT